DASNRDRITQLLVGHLGAVFHPAPKRVLVIGFGSGMTVSAVARHPDVEWIDVVEIEPAVIRAAPHLVTLNRNVLSDKRVHVFLDDARNFLLTTRNHYDLIVSEPSNPWIAGVSSLFTDEFYREAKARLNPGGMFVQWVQAYSLFPEDFQMILGTFSPHFPQVTLWRGEPPDYLVLGQTRAEPLRLDRLRRMWDVPGVHSDFLELGIDRPEGIMAFHRLDDADLRILVSRTSVRNTDDRTVLEYRAPRALLAEGLDHKNNQLIWDHRLNPGSQIVQVEDLRASLIAAAMTLVRLEDRDAEHFLKFLADAPESAELLLARGRWSLHGSRFPDARTNLQRALQLDPNLIDAAYYLGEVARRSADLSTAELMFRQVLARKPEHIDAMRGLMQVARSRNRWEEAIEWQARLLKAFPEAKADDYSRLGELLTHANKMDLAERAFLAALERDPYSYSAHRNLAMLYQKKGDAQRTQQQLEFIIRFFPTTDAAVYVNLAQLYSQQKERRNALAVLRKGNRIFPKDQEILRMMSVTH
ncbi:MAG TPA: fused MFS/spermidine synthase, partial [Candidatus Nitrosotenuis sp.]|nr:fused MFS/spermidine synthase [Candidatus Nitrosotenuis sp.]